MPFYIHTKLDLKKKSTPDASDNKKPRNVFDWFTQIKVNSRDTKTVWEQKLILTGSCVWFPCISLTI